MKLLLLHGFTGAPASWREVIAALPLSWSVAAEPLLGHSPATLTDVGSFEAEVDRLALTLREPVTVAGYSLGARVALGLCVRHPRLVSRAVLLGVNPGLDTAERAARQASDAHWIARLAQGIESFCREWEAQPLFATERALPAERVQTVQAIRRAHSAEGLALSLLRLGLGAMPDWRPPVRALPMPIDLVVGALDEKFVGLARELHAARSTSSPTTLTLVPGAGHSLLAEAPFAIAEVLRRTP